MSVLLRRSWIALFLVAALGLAGCGKEPQQRAAFIQLLQTRILDRSGVHIPRLSDDEKNSLGGYAEHFDVISEFNRTMNKSVGKDMPELMAKGSIRSIADVIKRRDDVVAARASAGTMVVALDAAQAQADKARAALKQPDDLKAVYDKAYDRTVTAPANTFREIFPVLDLMLDSALKLADYVKAHRSQITINGSQFEVQDPKVMADVNKMLEEINSHSKEMEQAQRKVNSVFLGR